jgi:hypothetical protein
MPIKSILFNGIMAGKITWQARFLPPPALTTGLKNSLAVLPFAN